ncbi:MAG: hypothetical protein HY718_12670, partial [Planctomycetes bacterium]|nr:hypothetical protein [Planctomycetota bacterium]
MRYIGCQVVLLIAAVAWAAPAGAERPPFDYFQNSWSVIGLKDYNFGTRITPDNELLLAGKRKVRFRIGPDLKPLSRAQVKVCANGWYPMILLSTTEGGVAYQFEFWATPLPSVPDWKAAFDGPVAGLRHDGAATAAQAGEDFLNWVVVGMTTLGRGVYPAKVWMEIIDGDKVDGQTREWALETVRAEILCDVYRIPFEASYDEARFSDEDWQVWRNRTREYWEQRVRGTTRIIVPDEKATDALLAAHVTQLIASDHGEVHGGEGFYDEFYIRDGAYQVMELEEAGMMDVARVAVGKYLEHQLPDGRFESQKGQFDANGQAVWVLWQFYKITGDAAWLAEVYPKMRRAVDWTMKARRQAPADSPFAGVLPNAVADGEYLWDGKHHIVGYDFWNLRGMLCTADAAKALDRRDEAGELMKEADAYRAAIDAAWKRTDVPYFPPSWEKAGT